VFYPNIGSSFDGKINDFMFKIRGTKKDSGNVIIIDVDEKSIAKLGQWPWSRDKIAQILNNLTDAGIGIIGFDVVFAEKDRSSPAKIVEKFNIKVDQLPNYDNIFANTIASTPTILGYQFELEDKKFIKHEEIDIPAIFIERGKPKDLDTVINANGTILNHKLLQESAYSSGFFNNVPDDGGVVRSVPLIIRYDGVLYPSLILEIVRASMGIDKVFVNYSELGVENIQIGDFKIPTDRYGRLIINYRGPAKTFKYISAVDIYNNDFNKSAVNGKIALIGTSAAGLLDLRATPFESIYPGVEVHANGIDNIITQDFIYSPTWVEGINFIVILTLSLLVVLLSTWQ
jgi:adenylate cyclase